MKPFINIVLVFMMHREYKLYSVKEELINLSYYGLLFNGPGFQTIDLVISRYDLVLQKLILHKKRVCFLCEYFIDI